jgi:hypothetical protein
MAGVVPYLATSLETVYLAWEMNNAATTGSGFLISGETAELMLHMIEPLQIGYGAVVSLRSSPFACAFLRLNITCRFSLFSGLSIGALSGPVTVGNTALSDT